MRYVNADIVKCTMEPGSIFTDELTSLLLPRSYMYTINRQHLIGVLILRHLHDVPFHIHV